MKRTKAKWVAAAASGLLVLSVLLVFLFSGSRKEIPLSQRIPNNAEIVQSVRKALREHSRQITVSFSYEQDVLSELTQLADEWVEQALEETERPDEGDYIRYQLGGYESNARADYEDGIYKYTLSLTPRYYTYLVQEEEVSEAVTELMEGFAFDADTEDSEKVRVIYDYVCTNIRYDRVHLKHPTATLRSTAYAALKWKTVTCQGYSVLLYRLLREAGLRARIVTGSTPDDSFHAWNIVELDGIYYQLDATWDAGKENYSCFLCGTENFDSHTLDEAFCADSFKEKHALAKNNYDSSGRNS